MVDHLGHIDPDMGPALDNWAENTAVMADMVTFLAGQAYSHAYAGVVLDNYPVLPYYYLVAVYLMEELMDCNLMVVVPAILTTCQVAVVVVVVDYLHLNYYYYYCLLLFDLGLGNDY